jgi:predicted glycosyltransferase
MVKIIAAADLVVGMGGYNTVCEILTQGTPSIIIPRDNPRREQLIRAEVLNNQNLVNYIPFNSLNPELLRKEIKKVLDNPEPYKKAIADFQLTGFDVMHQRLHSFR